MERLPGETFLGSTLELDRTGAPRMLPWGFVRQGLQMLLDMPRRLAEVDVRMHAREEAGLPWQTRTVEGQSRRMSALVDQSSLDGLRPGVEWLAAHLPAARDPVVVCHGDMQPLNLLVADLALGQVEELSSQSKSSPPRQALPFLSPDRHDHLEAAQLRNRARQRGVQAGTIDAILAQLCIRYELRLLTTDVDFARIAVHEPLERWTP